MPTDSNTLFVKPVDGAHVRDPERAYTLLPETGNTVPCNGYWLRRLEQGSVKKATAPKKSKPTGGDK